MPEVLQVQFVSSGTRLGKELRYVLLIGINSSFIEGSIKYLNTQTLPQSGILFYSQAVSLLNNAHIYLNTAFHFHSTTLSFQFLVCSG